MSDRVDDVRDRVAAALGEEYEILRLLGRGGMASVYLARERSLDRLVALKVLDPGLAARHGFRARFEREAAMAAQLQHPNIVPVYRVGEVDGVAFFTMGYVEGETLADLMRHRGRLELADALRILRQVASALGTAHRRGIIHRDVKPHNILIDGESGRALVTDFGIARAAVDPDDPPDGGGRTESVTEVGLVMGTPRYMSPEQASGTRELTPASDLYALGVIGYEMVSGQYPYRVTTPPNYQVAHLTQQPIPLVAHIGDFPKALDDVIHRLLHKDPSRRLPSAQALVEVLDHSGPGGAAPSRISRVAIASRVLAGVAVAAVLVGSYTLMGRATSGVVDPRRSVLVGFFENATGDPNLDWLRIGGVEQLAQSLSRWQDLNIIHVERLLDLARRARLDEGAPLSREDAVALAREASVGTATIGSIIRLGSTLRLSVRVYDVASRSLISTASVETPGDSTLPVAFEALADQILNLSGATTATLVSSEPPTRSIAAYQAYIEGVAARSRWDIPRARAAFERALEADPRFALAYHELSQIEIQTDFFQSDPRFVALADSALRYSAGRPPKERLLIEAYNAFVHADLPAARIRYKRLIASDSGIADAWIGLGDASYLDMTLRTEGEGPPKLAASFTEALHAYERALALDANDHRAYANLANLMGYAFLDDGVPLPVYAEPPPGDLPTVFQRIPVGRFQVLYLNDSLIAVPSESLAVRYQPTVITQARRDARDRAREIVERWLAIAPDEGTAHLLMARLLQSDRSYDEALVSLDRAAEFGTSTAVPLDIVRLLILLDARRFGEASELADRLETGEDGAIPGLLLSGVVNAYWAVGRLQDAHRVSERLFASLGNPGAATPPWARISGLLAPASEVTVTAALDRVDRDRVEELERRFEAELDATPPAERSNVAQVVAGTMVQAYAMLGDTAKVAAWRRRSDRSDIHGLDALVAIRSGDTVLAGRRYRWAAGDTTGSVADEYALAETAAGLGLQDQALVHLERMDSIRVTTLASPDPGWIRVVRSWPMRASILAAQGRVAEARVWYDRYLSAWHQPDSALAAERDRVRRTVGALIRSDRTDAPAR